jgi:hypothetical protein
MKYRVVSLFLCALVTVAAAKHVCRIHGTAMTRKQVPVIFLVCRHNEQEWQQYTNARARLFPYSCDEIVRMVDDLPLDRSGYIDWKKVPTNAWINVCPVCDERKGKWQAEHPPRKHEPGEVP